MKNHRQDQLPEEEKKQVDETENGSDKAGYTPEENEFADGKGTQLHEEIEKQEKEEDKD